MYFKIIKNIVSFRTSDKAITSDKAHIFGTTSNVAIHSILWYYGTYSAPKHQECHKIFIGSEVRGCPKFDTAVRSSEADSK